MSAVLDNLRSFLKDQSAKSEKLGSAFSFDPFRPGQDRRESRKTIERICKHLSNKITRVIDEDTREPIQEQCLPKQSRKFCELARILDDENCSREVKVGLISKPKSRVVYNFLKEYYETGGVKEEVAIYSMILLDRLQKTTGWTLRTTNWRILTVIAARVAQKVEGDPLLSVNDLHILYPFFKPAEYIKLESLFLKLIDYRCFTTLEEFQDMLHKLETRK